MLILKSVRNPQKICCVNCSVDLEVDSPKHEEAKVDKEEGEDEEGEVTVVLPILACQVTESNEQIISLIRS